MPLHLEWLNEGTLAISHTYALNGDLMYDPEMTFRVGREKGTLEPLTFRQDGSIQIYQEVYPEPGKWVPRLWSALNTFAQGWFKNISERGYRRSLLAETVENCGNLLNTIRTCQHCLTFLMKIL